MQCCDGSGVADEPLDHCTSVQVPYANRGVIRTRKEERAPYLDAAYSMSVFSETTNARFHLHAHEYTRADSDRVLGAMLRPVHAWPARGDGI